MNDQAATEEQHSEELEMLRRVLEPLGEAQCNALLALTAEYLEEVSPITFMAGHSEPGEDNSAVSWTLGSPSPLDTEATVFALFYDAEIGAGIAYTFKAIVLAQDEPPMAVYQRQYIYNPRYGTGPISLKALYNDLEFALTEHRQP